jgi:hypothetical protein
MQCNIAIYSVICEITARAWRNYGSRPTRLRLATDSYLCDDETRGGETIILYKQLIFNNFFVSEFSFLQLFCTSLQLVRRETRTIYVGFPVRRNMVVHLIQCHTNSARVKD